MTATIVANYNGLVVVAFQPSRSLSSSSFSSGRRASVHQDATPRHLSMPLGDVWDTAAAHSVVATAPPAAHTLAMASTTLPANTYSSEATTTVALPFMLSPTATVIVFVIGLIPFVVATVEFLRRIAGGEAFGTNTKDRVIFPTTRGERNHNNKSPLRVLGKEALLVAYFIFAIAAAVLALVLVSVVTSDPPPTELVLTKEQMLSSV